uniref:Uncharacterized protein n=1 Tax=Onchocerca volvulus TaxID=6282 RepID=A0A8R1TP57_ONCVO
MYRFLRYFILELIIISFLFGDFVVSEDEKIEETKIRKRRQFFESYSSYSGYSGPHFSSGWSYHGARAFPPPVCCYYGPPPPPMWFYGYSFGHGPMYGPMYGPIFFG